MTKKEIEDFLKKLNTSKYHFHKDNKGNFLFELSLDKELICYYCALIFHPKLGNQQYDNTIEIQPDIDAYKLGAILKRAVDNFDEYVKARKLE